MNQESAGYHHDAGNATLITLAARAERRLLRAGGSHRHVDFHLAVGEPPARERQERAAVALALVLDRSGSMHGEKLATAKEAALAVVERLSAQDQLALVVFDDHIDVVQETTAATPEAKQRIRQRLARIEARGSTALHEGWLVGCKAIAPDSRPSSGGLARCFLLTDGLANVGLSEPERIAAEAAGVREHAGIGTSTFGIGADYAEELLGPLAVAGGGQFHHLRHGEDIARTFVGELGELLSVAAGNVRLELEGGRDITVELVSEYRASQPLPGLSAVSVGVGDLPANEERHIVVRFGFPPQGELAERTVQARLLWTAAGREWSTAWQNVPFAYADNAACDAERLLRWDATVMHWVGLHYGQRAKREAALLNRQGDLRGAGQRLERVARRIAEYAREDAALRQLVQELRRLAEELSESQAAPMRLKEVAFNAIRTSRNQKDFRPPM
ncbi:MAG: vWA domain-containing protein [Chloroflexota bacterium]